MRASPREENQIPKAQKDLALRRPYLLLTIREQRHTEIKYCLQNFTSLCEVSGEGGGNWV